MDTLARIEQKNDHGSKGQRALAAYILRHYDKAAFMTAQKLGQTVGVSESTVVRFAAELGYTGYPDMQKALQDMVRSRLTSVQRMEVGSEQYGQQDVIKQVLQNDVELIRQTTDILDRQVFNAAIDAILDAKRLYIIGARSSAALANFMGYYMNLLCDGVTMLRPSNALFEQVMRVNQDDVVIGISFPRYSRDTLQTMRYAKTKGATVIALTDNIQSPPAAIAHHTLLASGGINSFVDSLVAPMSLINAILVTLGQRRSREFINNFGELERIWAENGVYE
ncbi:MAG: MurR/RpiR family transcriptional regulator [Oscillospiraceae bacterium]|nr:MurR/RpiR family transcriptional regulator [Oscillospiraceae bacterium]